MDKQKAIEITTHLQAVLIEGLYKNRTDRGFYIHRDVEGTWQYFVKVSFMEEEECIEGFSFNLDLYDFRLDYYFEYIEDIYLSKKFNDIPIDSDSEINWDDLNNNESFYLGETLEEAESELKRFIAEHFQQKSLYS